MSNREWYYQHAGIENGPVSFSSLKDLAAAGQVLPEDPVWAPHSSHRLRASDVPGLFHGAPDTDEPLPPMATDRVARPDEPPLAPH